VQHPSGGKKETERRTKNNHENKIKNGRRRYEVYF
jgi:hypothetical protein